MEGFYSGAFRSWLVPATACVEERYGGVIWNTGATHGPAAEGPTLSPLPIRSLIA
jgi:hypothetical protein